MLLTGSVVHGLLSLLFCTTQHQLHSDGTTLAGLNPLTSVMNQEIVHRLYRSILWRHFINYDSFVLDLVRFVSSWKKSVRTSNLLIFTYIVWVFPRWIRTSLYLTYEHVTVSFYRQEVRSWWGASSCETVASLSVRTHPPPYNRLYLWYSLTVSCIPLTNQLCSCLPAKTALSGAMAPIRWLLLYSSLVSLSAS